MLTAFTRAVSPRISECELTFIDRQPINFERAVQQHQQYEEMLRSLGVGVLQIPADDQCPDSCFLEDTALVLDEHTILADATRLELSPFSRYEVVQVPAEEWMAANVLLVNGNVCLHSGFRKTIGLLQQRGIEVRMVDISEFLKAEAGLTCMSLIFEI